MTSYIVYQGREWIATVDSYAAAIDAYDDWREHQYPKPNERNSRIVTRVGMHPKMRAFLRSGVC